MTLRLLIIYQKDFVGTLLYIFNEVLQNLQAIKKGALMKKRISESITGRNELVNLEMIEATNGFFETFQVASLDRIKYDLLFHLKVVGFLLLLQY